MWRQIPLVLALGLLASPVAAQPTFAEVDKDRDGRFERTEFYSVVGDAGLYGKWDSDNDGFIEQDEFKQIGFDNGFGEFGAWDEDSNGFLDATETYDGIYEGFDEDESGHWDTSEWDDAGDAGWFDV